MFWSTVLLALVTNFSMAQQPEVSDVPPDFPNLRFRFNPTYHSIGLKLGNVLNVRRQRPIFSTFEGELMLGLGSGPEIVVDRACVQSMIGQGTSTRRTTPHQQEELRRQANEECALFINPWRFSFLSQGLFDHVELHKNRPVVMYYVNYYIAPSHLLMQTKNQILDVFPVQPDLKMESSFRVRAWTGVQPEAGVIIGRVVQASIEYPVRKTYEIIIQESENANNFRAMSVSSAQMFQYINHAMLTGRRVRIEYIRLYRPHSSLLSKLFNYMTNLRITGVELLDD